MSNVNIFKCPYEKGFILGILDFALRASDLFRGEAISVSDFSKPSSLSLSMACSCIRVLTLFSCSDISMEKRISTHKTTEIRMRKRAAGPYSIPKKDAIVSISGRETDIIRKNRATANHIREYSSRIFCLLIKLKTKIKRNIDTRSE